MISFKINLYLCTVVSLISNYMRLVIGRVSVPRHSVIWGVGSLGNIRGNYVSFRSYMRGNNFNDIRKDWQQVGNDMRIVLSQMEK